MRETPAGVYMMPADQGGCMVVMHAGAPVYPGSKTDHIMSRYRPIAPKPVAKAEGHGEQADAHSMSSLSADNSTTKSSSGGPKRARKRPPDGKKPRKTLTPKPAEANFKLTPIFSDRVAPGFGPGGLQRFKDSCEQSPQSDGVSVSLSLLPHNVHSTLRCKAVADDRGFMERAAASTPSLFSAGNVGTKRGYSTSFGAESEVCSGALFPSMFGSKRESLFACPSASTSFGAESEVCSVEEAAESRKANLVTLSLLPDTPSFVNTRQNSSSTTTPSRWGSEKPTLPATELNTSLTMSSRGRWSDEDITESVAARPLPHRTTEASQADTDSQAVDAHYLEQRHGASSEAVMLTDELDRVLWVNSAFKRLNNERMSSRMQVSICVSNLSSGRCCVFFIFQFL
jgi:hypothetical protein